MSYKVENIIKDINKFKLIYKSFLYFNKIFSILLNIIPNEIFILILEYYYDSIINDNFKCNKIECIKNFKICIKGFIQSNKNVESYTEYYHCNEKCHFNCHSFFNNDEMVICYYCEFLRCPNCIEILNEDCEYFLPTYICNYCNIKRFNFYFCLQFSHIMISPS